MGTVATITEQAGSISQEKQTYRAYAKTETDAKGNTVLSEIKAQAEADKKDKNTGLSVNWQKLEDAGYTLFSENEFVKYTVKSVEAARLLVPEEAQFIYIFQCGLNYIQNAKANAAMTAVKEGTPEPEPEFNQLVIDLRDGVDENGKFSINETPTRRSTSSLDKFIKQADALLTAMGVPEDEKAAKIAAMVASLQATPEEE